MSSSTSSSLASSASGAVSSIDWSQIVTEMISAESQPLVALQGEHSTVTQEQQVYTALRSTLSSLQTAAFNLSSIGGQALQTSVGDSTNDAVATVTPQNGATPASASLDVTALASAATAVSGSSIYAAGAATSASAPVETSSADIASSSSFDPTAGLSSQSANLNTSPASSGSITINGTAVSWTDSDSLDDVLGLINSANAGVTATYNSSSGEVSLTGTSTGAGSSFVVSESSGNLLETLGLSAGTYTGSNADSFDPTATLASQSSFLGTAVSSGTFTLNGVTFEVDPATDSLDDLVSAINNSGAGATAYFNSSTGEFDLSTTAQGSSAQLTLGSSGDTSNFLSAFNMSAVTAGQDAQVSVNGGATQSLASNTSTTLLAGGTVTLAGLGSTTVSVGSSSSDAAAAVETFVGAYNTAVSAVNGFLSQAPADSTPETGTPATQAADATPSIQGAFSGNSLLEQTLNTIIDQVVDTKISGGSITALSQIGLTMTTNNGGESPPTLSFNESTFASAYSSDPDAVSALVSDPTTGLASNLYTDLQGLVNPATGAYTNEINGESSDLSNLSTQITSMDSNLNYQQKALTLQYEQLAATLDDMQSKGNQISSQLGTLSEVS